MYAHGDYAIISIKKNVIVYVCVYICSCVSLMICNVCLWSLSDKEIPRWWLAHHQHKSLIGLSVSLRRCAAFYFVREGEKCYWS